MHHMFPLNHAHLACQHTSYIVLCAVDLELEETLGVLKAPG